jgi:hypothetical protein
VELLYAGGNEKIDDVRSSSIIRTVFPDAGPFADFIAENVSVRQ